MNKERRGERLDNVTNEKKTTHMQKKIANTEKDELRLQHRKTTGVWWGSPQNHEEVLLYKKIDVTVFSLKLYNCISLNKSSLSYKECER